MSKNNIQDAINAGINNLKNEAYLPLIRFAKNNLNIEMEQSTRDMILKWAKRYIFLNRDFHLSDKILSSLDNAIAYVQSSIRKFHPTLAKRFFNYIQDKYAANVAAKYFSSKENKDAFVSATTEFAKKGVLTKVLKSFGRHGITLTDEQFQAIKAAAKNLIDNIEDDGQTLTHIDSLKTVMKTLPQQAQLAVLDIILQKNSLKEDIVASFNQKASAELVKDFQTKINRQGIHAIKKAQARQIYQYDGLIERVLPASIRGLYDVDKSVVESIALTGDNSKDEDLFNFEVASNARYNKTYDVGHTGASNRSATTLANIAMYFASKHGLRNGKPDSTWIMIYETSKGINTTELVDKKVEWTEFEFASPELKANRFLGAVKFEVDDANTTQDNIAFKAVDGFVVPRVHEGKFRKEGIEGDIKSFLDIAKYFDNRAGHPSQPDLTFSLPTDDKKISEDRTFFQRIFDKIGLSHHPIRYKNERLQQLKFVTNETPKQKAARLEKEKAELSFWHAFSDQLSNGATTVSSWLPSFNALVKRFKPEQKEEVVEALKAKLSAKAK